MTEYQPTQQTIPCKPILDTGITLMPGTPQINNSVRAEPYKDVRAYWEKN
jgi:hypothetical protein